MKFQISTAALVLLSITGVFAAPAPQDDGSDSSDAPDATSSSVAAASATSTSSSIAVASATGSPQISINLPYSVFDRVNFDPALTRLSSGSTARVIRRNGPSFEAASANLFYVSSSTTSGTCTLDFRFRSSVGSTVSGTGQSQVFTCNPVYDSKTGAVTKCTRDQFIGTIQAKLDGTTSFIPGQGRASGVYPCSYFAGRTVGIDMAAAGDVDAIYWKVGSGDGPYIRYSA